MKPLKCTLLIHGLLVLSLFGCNSTDANEKSETSAKSEQTSDMKDTAKPQVKVSKTQLSDDMKKALAVMQGTVKYFPMEGGFYGIVTENGDKFLPMNLEAKFKQDGAVIKFSGQPIKDLLTIQQWGTPFRLSEVELIKEGSKSNAADM